MKDRSAKHLHDIGSASKAIVSFSEGKGLGEYLSDELLRSAIERKFETFGKIGFAHQIVGMRNRLIHGYDAIDEEIIWDTISSHIPTLITEVDKLLSLS